METLKFKIFKLSLLIVFVAPLCVEASRFEVEVPKDDSTKPYVANIYLIPEGETLNAVEGKITLIAPLPLPEIRYGNSAVSLWVEEPSYDGRSGEVVFSGVIPNGFLGDRALILSLIFSSESKIWIEGATYKNDGLGTRISLSKNSARFTTSINSDYTPIERDFEPPESFDPLIGEGTLVGEQQKHLFFATQDKFSGIDRYEVSEARPFLFFFEPKEKEYRPAQSPYALEDEGLESFVYVKAIDKNGNERIEKISPIAGPYPYRYNVLSVIIFILLILALYIKSARVRG